MYKKGGNGKISVEIDLGINKKKYTDKHRWLCLPRIVIPMIKTSPLSKPLVM